MFKKKLWNSELTGTSQDDVVDISLKKSTNTSLLPIAKQTGLLTDSESKLKRTHSSVYTPSPSFIRKKHIVVTQVSNPTSVDQTCNVVTSSSKSNELTSKVNHSLNVVTPDIWEWDPHVNPLMHLAMLSDKLIKEENIMIEAESPETGIELDQSHDYIASLVSSCPVSETKQVRFVSCISR